MTSLNPAFKVGNQVGEVLRRHLSLSRADARRRTIELLDLVRIPSPERRVDEYPHQLSGGMRQRVMIAMALACDPKILIADEPTTALDVTIQAGILDLMRDIRERLGTAIVLITHNLGVVADVADRVLVMYAGRKVEEAPVHDLFARPQHPYTVGLLGAVPAPGRPARLHEIPGRVPSLARAADGVRVRAALPARGRALALPGAGAARDRAAPSRRVLPSRPGATPRERPSSVLEVEGLVKHFPVRGFGAKGVVHAVDGVSFSIGRGELARPRRRVGQRKEHSRELHHAARHADRRHDPAQGNRHHAPLAPRDCGRCAATCTWCSRIRTRRSTRA